MIETQESCIDVQHHVRCSSIQYRPRGPAMACRCRAIVRVFHRTWSRASLDFREFLLSLRLTTFAAVAEYRRRVPLFMMFKSRPPPDSTFPSRLSDGEQAKRSDSSQGLAVARRSWTGSTRLWRLQGCLLQIQAATSTSTQPLQAAACTAAKQDAHAIHHLTWAGRPWQLASSRLIGARAGKTTAVDRLLGAGSNCLHLISF